MSNRTPREAHTPAALAECYDSPRFYPTRAYVWGTVWGYALSVVRAGRVARVSGRHNGTSLADWVTRVGG